MLLAIDIGNTNIVFGLFSRDELVFYFRLETDASRPADDYEALIYEQCQGKGLKIDNIHGAVMASVAPQLDSAIARVCTKLFGKAPLIVDASTHTGITIGYETRHSLGADRIANAVAAYEKYRSAVIVIDMGTATTFDYIDAGGVFLGGAIAPGIKTAGEALFQKAAMLPRIDFVYPGRIIGRTTAECMQSGIVAGYVGLVEGLIARIKAEAGADMRVIATGGLARLVSDHTAVIDSVDDHLLLRGLKIIYERNTNKR
jgi:type III pantothenate kinase